MHNIGNAANAKNSKKIKNVEEGSELMFTESKKLSMFDPIANNEKNSLNSKDIKYPNNGKIKLYASKFQKIVGISQDPITNLSSATIPKLLAVR